MLVKFDTITIAFKTKRENQIKHSNEILHKIKIIFFSQSTHTALIINQYCRYKKVTPLFLFFRNQGGWGE